MLISFSWCSSANVFFSKDLDLLHSVHPVFQNRQGVPLLASEVCLRRPERVGADPDKVALAGTVNGTYVLDLG